LLEPERDQGPDRDEALSLPGLAPMSAILPLRLKGPEER
jgi:hypothetical protein